MTEKDISNRITQLRLQKNVSEYKMSLALGHSKGYIQSISSGRTMPSLGEFFAICEYLEVTPKQFFDDDSKNPALTQKIVESVSKLSEKDQRLVLEVSERLGKE